MRSVLADRVLPLAILQGFPQLHAAVLWRLRRSGKAHAACWPRLARAQLLKPLCELLAYEDRVGDERLLGAEFGRDCHAVESDLNQVSDLHTVLVAKQDVEVTDAKRED